MPSKNKRPRVLLIGERHPTEFYEWIDGHTPRIANFIEKIAKMTKEKKEAEWRDFFNKIADTGLIVENEIRAINDFGTRRILFEHYTNTERNRKLCAKLLDRKNSANLEQFGEELLKSAIITLKAALPEMDFDSDRSFIGLPENIRLRLLKYKVVLLIIAATGIYDIGFFEDEKTIRRSIRTATIAGSLMAENSKRERFMIKNIRSMLTDRTVIICGRGHFDVVKEGIENIANVKAVKHIELY